MDSRTVTAQPGILDQERAPEYRPVACPLGTTSRRVAAESAHPRSRQSLRKRSRHWWSELRVVSGGHALSVPEDLCFDRLLLGRQMFAG